MNDRLVYTVQEVAKILHSSPNYIYTLIEKGYLPALKLGSIKILKSTLEKFLVERKDKIKKYCLRVFSDLTSIKPLKVQQGDDYK